MYCPNCGQQQPDNTKFCINCGKPLQAQPDPQQSAQDQPAVTSAPVTPPPVNQAPVQTVQPTAPTKKPWYKRWWIWVILGIASTMIISALGITFGERTESSSSGKNSSVTASSASSAAEEEKATEAKEEKTEAPAPTAEDPETVKKDFIDSCETIDYKTLARNPDSYKGDHLKFTGQVIQVLESNSIFNDSTTLRVNVTSEDNEFAEGGVLWTDTIICTVTIPDGGDRILEKDIIDLYGECYGLYTYKTVLGNNESIPRIDIEYYAIHK